MALFYLGCVIAILVVRRFAIRGLDRWHARVMSRLKSKIERLDVEIEAARREEEGP